MLKDIIDNLQCLKQIYQQIYDVSLKKKQAIIDGDVQAVSEIVKQEWELLSRVSDLEEKRVKAVQKFAEEKGIEPDERLSLSDMEKWVHSEDYGKLRKIAEELRHAIAAQKKINNENKGLIQLHLDYMDYMVNIVLKEPQVSNIYGSTGEIPNDDVENRTIIDNQV